MFALIAGNVLSGDGNCPGGGHVRGDNVRGGMSYTPLHKSPRSLGRGKAAKIADIDDSDKILISGDVTVSVLPSVLKPDEYLSLGELNLVGEFDAFFARQERLPHKPVFHRVQLSSGKHRSAAAPAAAVAMATRTWQTTPVRWSVVWCTPVIVVSL